MNYNEATRRFVNQHLDDDVRQLALQHSTRHNSSSDKGEGGGDGDVDLPFALDQIRGRQIARRKLPTWAAIDGILYPPHLSMEQCSSEQTARYKAAIVERLKNSLGEGRDGALVDLTGGFGVDFAFMAQSLLTSSSEKCPTTSFYVERNPHLCDLARHNFPLLGLSNTEVVCSTTEEFLNTLWSNKKASLAGGGSEGANASPAGRGLERAIFYLDPARRDDHGGRTYGIADCSPNILELRDTLLANADYVLLKLSPMLDWRKAVSDLGEDCISEVHIVSVHNECKELLVVLRKPHGENQEHSATTLYCVNDQQLFTIQSSSLLDRSIGVLSPSLRSEDGVGLPTLPFREGLGVGSLYEPNASIMKAGCFRELCVQFGLVPVGPNSHLFVRNTDVADPSFMAATDKDFPGRVFQISAISSMNKRSLRQHLQGISQANIATRNFPLKPDELRRHLKLRDGGDSYLFGTTLADGSHVIIVCHKRV